MQMDSYKGVALLGLFGSLLVAILAVVIWFSNEEVKCRRDIDFCIAEGHALASSNGRSWRTADMQSVHADRARRRRTNSTHLIVELSSGRWESLNYDNDEVERQSGRLARFLSDHTEREITITLGPDRFLSVVLLLVSLVGTLVACWRLRARAATGTTGASLGRWLWR